MILFRTRQWGAAEWTQIQIGSAEQDDEIEQATSSIIGSALATSGLHAQVFDRASGAWEDLE